MAAGRVPRQPPTSLDMTVSEHASWTCKVHVAKLPCMVDSKGPKKSCQQHATRMFFIENKRWYGAACVEGTRYPRLTIRAALPDRAKQLSTATRCRQHTQVSKQAQA